MDSIYNREHSCSRCKYLRELEFWPNGIESLPEYGWCCIYFANEGQVMQLFEPLDVVGCEVFSLDEEKEWLIEADEAYERSKFPYSLL